LRLDPGAIVSCVLVADGRAIVVVVARVVLDDARGIPRHGRERRQLDVTTTARGLGRRSCRVQRPLAQLQGVRLIDGA